MIRSTNNSTVYITGAGPGNPSLLTIKAREIIEKADVITYDNLVSKEILELALLLNPRTKLVCVGKVGGQKEKSLSQEQINNLLLELSKDNKIICRLKGGDPNIFGRGAEEAIFLRENNINFEIVPGVSSITAAPAYAGIPLTHRDCTSSFTVLTAHEDPDSPYNTINWESFDAINSTLVLLMGTKHLSKIAEKLISLGRSKDTPLAIIYKGTTSSQNTRVMTLKDVVEKLNQNPIKTPSIIIIGDVVNYRDILNWYESKMLFGKKILITRPKEQSMFFAERLISLGAKPVISPLVSYLIEEKEIYNKNIINNIPSFDWIFFTSQNAVKFFFEILNKNCYDSRILSQSQIAAVGYKTKLELEKYNIKADFVPKKFSFNDLIDELSERENLKEKRILHPTQNVEARLIASLPSIMTWHIYKANFVNNLDEEIINQIKEGIDIYTFFSSNTLIHFNTLLEKYDLKEIVKKVIIATIGEETSKSAKELFGKVDIIAEPFTEEGLIMSIEKYFEKETISING